MGYADGYYYGQGRIICDTSTFSVGDTIRVRSMTDSSKVWNQQVATVGMALVFTVPCYDYYKICTVQTINDTPTEIGGVYKTVDYGQTLFIDVLDKTTLGGIQGILNAHQETQQLSIGDEVTVKIYNGQLEPVDWKMLIGAINLYDPHEVILSSKNLYGVTTLSTPYFNVGNEARIMAQSFYSNIETRDKSLIKNSTRSARAVNSVGYTTYSDYVWIPNVKEVFGTDIGGTPPTPRIQFSIFATQINRVKSYNGNTKEWWLTDGGNANNQYFSVNTSGASVSAAQSSSYGVLPCFRLTADS